MPKMYKAECIAPAHKDKKCELKSFVGEDLTDFKNRMRKQGHEVGELKNSAYQLSEKGYMILSNLQNSLVDLASEYQEITGSVDISGISSLADPVAEVLEDVEEVESDEEDEDDSDESEGSE